MADTKYSLGHSRKPKGRVGVGGQPVQSWDDGIELQPTTSLGSVTAAQNTSVGAKDNRHAVAQTWATKQAFTHRKKEREPSFGTILSKNSPVKVSVSGEWALQECEEFTNWANVLLKKGRYRSITDIRKSIGDGQTLVHILEVLAGQKIPGVYARPVTKAQKLENLQLCMSFMGNRDINLQGIYVGDLIDGNLNSILSLCGNLQKKFEGWQAHTPESKRPYSSDSTKQNGRLTNGHVNHNMKDYDVDTNKPHGSSSGYHSEEYSPTRVTSNISLQMPGMMTDPHLPHNTTNTINPSDVIVSTTKLDSKSVYQSGYEQRKNQNVSIPHQQEMDSDVISPSVEERLRSLLNTPNPGGLEEETDDELMIPPPRRRSDVQEDESFDVEERLKSLLDYDVDGFSEEEYDDDMDEDSKGVDALNKLDAIGYMPSHPSEKMRNISPIQKRQDSFTGRSRLRTAKLPTPPALRRIHNARANEGLSSTERTRKISVAKGPGMHLTRTTVSSSELPKIQHSSIMMQKTKNLERDALNEKNSPDRRTTSHSDFLQQVASRLANEVDNKDTTTASSASISPPDTPMLPTLSPSSSIASFMFSSDSSGTATPVRGHSSRLKVDNRSFRTDNRNDESLTPRRRNRGKIGSGGKSRSANDLESIKTQLESLESMYADVLCLLDEGVTENKSKSTVKNTVVNQEKTEELKAGIMAFRKQRSKDIKSVNKRFGRLESHVVTLARSVAHLSSELRSQAAVNEDLNEMRKEIKRLRTLQEEIESRKSCGVQQSDQYTANLKRINKLRKFFGSEPPLLDNFLKKLGYERFAAKFGSEQIGILELPYLNEERLQSLGIPLGPRLRIVEEALKLRF